MPASVASNATITTDHSGRPSSSLCDANQAINNSNWMPRKVTASSLALKERGNTRESPAYKRIQHSGKRALSVAESVWSQRDGSLRPR